MKDDEQGPSEDEDSEATALPSGDDNIKSPGVGDTIDGKPVVAEFDMNRMLPADIKWLCVGKAADKTVALFIPDDWEPDELSGFIHRVAHPDFLIANINNSRK